MTTAELAALCVCLMSFALALSDLGRTGPWSRSKKALENRLAETERRLQD